MRIPIQADISLLSTNGVRISVSSMLHGLLSIEVIYPNNSRNTYYASRCEIANRISCATLLCTDFHGNQLEIALNSSINTRFFGESAIAEVAKSYVVESSKVSRRLNSDPDERTSSKAIVDGGFDYPPR